MNTTPTSGAADLPAMVSKALREAYYLGQRYWQQTDSEYISQHKKADDTRAKFLALVEETCAALAAGQATAGQQPDSENLRKALKFYGDGEHFIKADDTAWDTVSGEPQNYWCDEAGTATVEDGHIARLALSGHLVRFEDDAAQPAAQPGAAYAALPDPYCNAHDDADACYPDMFSEQQMRAFADATHTLRASRGQAPAQHTGPCVVCGSDEPFTGTCGSRDPRALCKQPTTTAHEADSAPAVGYPPLPNLDGSDEQIWEAIFNWKTATPGADAVRKANKVENAIIGTMRACVDADRAARAPADSVQEDAARYRLLRRGQHWTVVDGTGDYLRAEALDTAVDAARKQGEKQ